MTADEPRSAETAPTHADTSPSAADGPPGLPRWVRLSAVLLAIAVLALVALVLLGGHEGPGRHFGGHGG